MNKRLLHSVFFTFMLLLLLVSCGKKVILDDYGCFLRYEDAYNNAQKKKLPMLVFFTSEGDDELNTQFVADIFKSADFATEILSKYSVYHADFSQNAFQKTVDAENPDSEEQELANTYTEILQDNYGKAMLFSVETMPSVFLCTKEGFVVSSLDFDSDFVNMQEFRDTLDEYAPELEKFNSMVEASKKGSSSDKLDAIDTLYNATDGEYTLFLLPLIEEYIKLDKENKSGLCGKYILAQAEAIALSAYSKGDVETAVKTYLEAANNSFVNDEGKQECFYTAAYLVSFSGSEDYSGILSYLQTAYELAPNSEKAAAIKEAVDYYSLVLENYNSIDTETTGDAE